MIQSRVNLELYLLYELTLMSEKLISVNLFYMHKVVDEIGIDIFSKAAVKAEQTTMFIICS